MKKLLALGLALVSNSPALTINVIKADNSDTANPSFDPTLSQLEGIMIAAADHWTDVIKDDHNLTIFFGYQDLNNDELGIAEVQAIAPNGHASQGAVAFDTRDINGVPRNWFFDPTPALAEEFSMRQVLVADHTPSTTSLYYEGNPPDQLEVGYWGNFNATYSGDLDLYTTALHEIGHILGMSLALPSYQAETSGDHTLDFDHAHLGGNSAEAHIFSQSGDGRVHLRSSDSLMSPSRGHGDRNLPSATDIFAVAAGGNWTDIRLKRVNSLSGTDWGGIWNWAAGQVPSKPQRVYIRHGETVEPLTNETLEAGSLRIFNDSILNIGDKTLDLKTDLHIGQSGSSSGILTTSPGGKIKAEDLVVTEESRLLVSGNGLEPVFDVDRFVVTLNAHLIGSGHLLSSGEFRINGTATSIAPVGAADRPLLLNAPTSHYFHLPDNSSRPIYQPIYHAELGNLAFATAPGFDLWGTLHIGAGRKATFFETVSYRFNADETLAGTDDNQTIFLKGGTASAAAAILEAPKGFIAEDGILDVKGFSQILGEVTFLDDATVNLNTGSTLWLNGTTFLKGGRYQGEGTLRLGDLTIVIEDTTIDCEIIDLDSFSVQPPARLHINEAQLTLNTRRIDAEGLQNTYNGELSLGYQARLNVHQTDNDSWTMAGSLTLHGSSIMSTMLTGDAISMEGDLFVAGAVQSTASMDFTSGNLNIPGPTSRLVLSNPNCIFGFSTTTAGSGTLDIAKNGGMQFDIGSSSSIHTANSGTMTLGLESEEVVGMVQVSNRFTQGSTGVLEVDLAGESENDYLAVSSFANLDGTLRLRYRDGFRAEVGDSFTILTAAALFGTFSKIEGPDGQRWEANYDPVTNTVRVEVTATAYEVWVDENGLTENINDGFFDDPDNDGDPNIKEFALNGNPLSSVGNCRLYPAITDTPEGRIFTVTFPVREGAEFSEGPIPEATIDAINYRVEGSNDLISTDLSIIPYPTALDEGLPALPSHYEYQTFQTKELVPDQHQAFVTVTVQPAM